MAMIRKRPFDSDTSSETDVLSENKRVKLATATVPGEHSLRPQALRLSQCINMLVFASSDGVAYLRWLAQLFRHSQPF